LVRDARKTHAPSAQRVECLGDARVEAGAHVQVAGGTGRETLDGRREEGGRLGRRNRALQPAAHELLDAVADPGTRVALGRRLEPEGLERFAEAVVQVGNGVDERAVEIEGQHLDAGLQGFTHQNMRTATSAGAARRSSSSSSRRSSVSDAPAISSDVQYSPT